ncbi:MAG: DNA gyrase inhibitor YacG [Alphaproteobacteria bacterium]
MDDPAASAKIVPLRPRAKPCPICGAAARSPFHPFCYKHCANKDLLNWLRGDYRLETDDAPMEDGLAGEDERND